MPGRPPASIPVPTAKDVSNKEIAPIVVADSVCSIGTSFFWREASTFVKKSRTDSPKNGMP